MANRYWVAATASVWDNTANWSTTSGGSGGASVPISTDTAIFDDSGLGACTTASSSDFDCYIVVNGVNTHSFTHTGGDRRNCKTVTINDTATIDLGSDSVRYDTSTWTVASGATVVSAGEVRRLSVINCAGTWNVASTEYSRAFSLAISQEMTFGGDLTYDLTVSGSGSPSVSFPSGTTVIEGDFVLNGGSATSYTADLSSNNASVTFKGNVSVETAGVWSAGTGTITLDNTAAQAVNFNGQTVEPVIVSDASTGTITLGANFTTEYVHDCNSLIDLNGYTITETGTDPSPCSANTYFFPAQFTRL